ncbi:MAG TPA: lipoyl(octanoyl) transferase LipB [Cyclobacteriaceae bacterium]|nr:lipoyl(octanoyl) transferase LipB [Cytophagales bacterium]HMR57624.1 lipoyl(octanoyl) transferase LipB [Cyclobacteriaceae bacterium]HNT50624.1 lipoyl(octanoyl) transferase LipB [Cyclobacteriaceae bacterium]HRE66816.1 lipoyl(octanoyl) transferase LipB [Cyclobacteriaceae bacterium]HRF33246.1 lipoyl(octanoyl) transferase LipB [Cyclobacteriaceae bacterium]
MNTTLNKKTKFIDLGLMDYKQAWDYQTNLFQSILDIKALNRNSGDQQITPNYLLFCEHPHVYTLGKSGNEQNLLVKKEELNTVAATYYHINRGGDITYHGPGQIVVYPIIDLENFFTDIHKYMRLLEEAVIQTLKEFAIQAGRIKSLTGVWIDSENEKNARKICALGVKTSRWVTMHGLAFNVNASLDYFTNIVPCGIADKTVTSLQKEMGGPQDIERVKKILKEKLISLFEMELIN